MYGVEQRLFINNKAESHSPVVGPPVYHTMKRALVQAIRPNFPHYNERPNVRVQGISSNEYPRTLSDVADNATRDRIHCDPGALFDAFLSEYSTRILHCQELLWQKYLQRTTRRVRP